MRKAGYLGIIFCLALVFASQASAAGKLFRTSEVASTIEELNPNTGALLNSFSTPIPISDGCSGLAFAYNRLFFQNCGSDIFELDPATGAVINSFPSPSGSIDGLGFSGAELYLLKYSEKTAPQTAGPSSYGKGLTPGAAPSPVNAAIYVLNPNTGAVIRVLNPGMGLVGGLTYAGGRNTLFASDVDTFTIYELNPLTGAVLNSFGMPLDDQNTPVEIYGLGYSFARKTLFLGDNVGLATIFEVNPDTGAVLHTLPVGPNWSLAADENGVAAAAVVPTLNTWGMMLFVALAGAGSLFYLRRQRKV